MVTFGRYSLYIVVVFLQRVSSLGHSRDLNYYDGARGRMDKKCDSHEEFFQSYNRPKRTLHSPNLWAKSSESQGVSCPTRLRENSLDTLGDSERVKEVVHIPCPKRNSGGAKVVASFRGKNAKCNGENRASCGNRGARELFRMSPRRYDLNHAVRENAQWLILSSQTRNQNPNQFYMGQSLSTNEQTSPNWRMNQPSQNSHLGVPPLDQPPMWKTPKEPEARKSHFNKFEPSNADPPKSQIQYQNNPNALENPKWKEPVVSEREQQLPIIANQGYPNMGLQPQSPRNQEPQGVPVQKENAFPRKDKLLPNPYENNRLLMNSYNLSYDGPHHPGPPNPLNSNSNPPGRSGYPNSPNHMDSSLFQSHITPGDSMQAIEGSMNNVTMPPSRMYRFNDTRKEPWIPGAVPVDLQPGHNHEPKIPKPMGWPNATRDLSKVNKIFPNTNSRIGYPQLEQHHPFPKLRSQFNSSKFTDYQQQLNPIVMEVGKTIQEDKSGGKVKKEESKIRFVKVAKGNNGHAVQPPADYPERFLPSNENVISNTKPAESSPVLSQQESRQQNSLAGNEGSRYNEDGQNYKPVAPRRKFPDRGIAVCDRGHQEYHNYTGDLSHVLDPPVTVNASHFTNKAHRIPSKFATSKDVPYMSFKGVPPARNDEAFYDKSMKFMGKIDRPPLVNIKPHKWSKLNGVFNNDQMYNHHECDPDGFYSEPAEFPRDSSEPKSMDRSSKKCHNNRRQYRLRSIRVVQ